MLSCSISLPAAFTVLSRLFRGVVGVLAVCALPLAFAATAHATPVTGDPQTNAFSWVPPSTNALNFGQLVPGREGQVAPYVMFNSNTLASVTLDFFNFAVSGIAFFETRIDDIATGANSHPVVTGDTIHTGGTFVANQASVLGKVFTASSHVDIRLALGGERDWDFDWTRFYVATAQNDVPAPATLALVGLGLIGVAATRRRKAA